MEASSTGVVKDVDRHMEVCWKLEIDKVKLYNSWSLKKLILFFFFLDFESRK